MSLPVLPDLTVIIPTYRDWEGLQHCLAALAKQRYPRERFEVLVVNNAPEESPPVELSWPANTRLLGEAKPGSYAARNRGIAEARGGILAFLDADCVPEPCWLEAGLACLAAGEGASLVAGRVELTFTGQRLRPAECFEKAFAFRQAQNATDGVSVTANLLARRRVFDAVGLFDDALMSGGDFEWTRRATLQGFRLVYCADCVVAHPARASVKALAGKARRVSTGSRELYGERGAFSGLRRVLGNVFADLAALCSRDDMAWRERYWALLVLGYLKAVKVHQRLQLALRPKQSNRERYR
ncbi:glycosyltransferase family 2 protein [Halomonas daqiaonensis]|uniref:Glycosyltransferase, GT2 family n=1 Tax=Halomonas daqiaonensis TaxID=650850 RepID=A0A1H7VXR6_9GAMM|nr:glycosyltransferase family A protein [Halomonas daqiaonensis]SEM13854.1 Glycosyltransferase, GT2 family [Halomonas daqiaonensis]